MKTKYFCVSDIHSYCSHLQSALKQAGFRKSNKDHILIVCGDVFDRGFETLETYEFLTSLPKSRCILVRGNHELLYMDLLQRGYPGSHDFSNGTVRTFCQIAEINEQELSASYWYADAAAKGQTITRAAINNMISAKWEIIRDRVSKHPITKWLNSDQWIQYYELDKYIFVHSFIPIQIKDIPETAGIRHYPLSYVPENFIETVPDWRNLPSSALAWDDAKWGCPWKQFNAGLFDEEKANNKILVCGHWHASDFHKVYENDKTQNMNLFFSDNLIALDACTAWSQFCNVLVIDSETKNCFDKFGNQLN